MKHVRFEFECEGVCQDCTYLDCPHRDRPYGSQSIPVPIEKE